MALRPRRTPVAGLLLGLVCSIAACGRAGAPSPPPPPPPSAAPSQPSAVPAFGHIFLIVMENLGYDDALRLPYTAALARRFAVATRYSAVAHPSLPNYLALVSGQTWVRSDCTDCYQNAPSLAGELDQAQRTWGAYLEDLPQPCWLGAARRGYAGKHDPFRYFREVRARPALACRLRPLSELESALRAGAELPDFVWVTPNLCHDMHDCSPARGDEWLSRFVPEVLASPAWKDGGVLFLVWDEAGGGDTSGSGGGHVLALAADPSLPAGLQLAAPYDHYSLLRTIEAAWGLPYLGRAAQAQPLGFWGRSGG